MPHIPEPIYGDVVITRHSDPIKHNFGLTVDRADSLILIDPGIFDRIRAEGLLALDGDRFTISGMNRVVVYQLTGEEQGNLVAKLVSDSSIEESYIHD